MTRGGKTETTPKEEQTLGAYLRNLRETRRMTLREVEEASDVSNAYLSQLEHGRIAKPSPHVLHGLATVYRVPYETLMEKAGYITRGGGTSKGGGTERRARLATFVDEELTQLEEEALLEYLAFLRSRKGTK
jgi:transcriptional regulator with XRE-family HTH domain